MSTFADLVQHLIRVTQRHFANVYIEPGYSLDIRDGASIKVAGVNVTGVLTGGVANAGNVYVDDDGWLIVPGQLPSKTMKAVLSDGTTEYTKYVLDNGVEKILASSKYP